MPFSLQIDKIGEMLEWLKRHAWKACGRQKRLASSNLALSAKSQKNASSLLERVFLWLFAKPRRRRGEMWQAGETRAGKPRRERDYSTYFRPQALLLSFLCKGPSGKEHEKWPAARLGKSRDPLPIFKKKFLIFAKSNAIASVL